MVKKSKTESRTQFGCFNLISRTTWLALIRRFALVGAAAGLVKEVGQMHVFNRLCWERWGSGFLTNEFRFGRKASISTHKLHFVSTKQQVRASAQVFCLAVVNSLVLQWYLSVFTDFIMWSPISKCFPFPHHSLHDGRAVTNFSRADTRVCISHCPRHKAMRWMKENNGLFFPNLFQRFLS